MANRLLTLRKKRGLTLLEVAEEVGISGAYLSLLERGLRKHPSETVLNRLADLYGVTPNQVRKPHPTPTGVDDVSVGEKPTPQLTRPVLPTSPTSLPPSVATFLGSENGDFLSPTPHEIRILIVWARRHPKATADEVMLFLVDRLRPGLPQ